jgi:hypothetical protein
MKKYFILIILSSLILFVCAQPSVVPTPTNEVSKQIIELEVVEQAVHYRCQSFWTGEYFSHLSESDLEARFNEKYNADARDFEFSFDKATYSTTIKCHISGAISKGTDSYTADLLWFLNPLGLDFIDNNFKESDHGLSLEGSIGGVPTVIEVDCPPQESIYEAWQQPVGHCHGHIWWPVSKTD